MTERTWKFDLEGQPHTLTLRHGYWSGKRVVTLDGREIQRRRKLADYGSRDLFTLDGHTLQLGITTNGITYDYYLLVDFVRIAAQESEGRRPSRAVQQAVGVASFWHDLAHRLGLRISMDTQQTPVLAGGLDGYFLIIHPITLRTKKRSVPALVAWVRHAPEANPPELLAQMAADPEMALLRGSDPKKLLPFSGVEGIKHLVLPFERKNPFSPGDLATRIRTFARLVSRYCAPLAEYGCEGMDCAEQDVERLQLIFYDAIPHLTCANCLNRQTQSEAEERAQYKQRRIKLEWVLLAALVMIPLVALLHAALVVWLEIEMPLMAALLTYTSVLWLAPRLGAKPSGWTIFLAALAGLAQIALSDFFLASALLVVHEYWAPTPAVLFEAARLVFVETDLAWQHVSGAAVLLGLLAISHAIRLRMELRNFSPTYVHPVGPLEYFIKRSS